MDHSQLSWERIRLEGERQWKGCYFCSGVFIYSSVKFLAYITESYHLGFPGGSEVKASACNVGDLGLTPGLGRSPEEGNGNPPQYSCLENPMDGGAWWATVHGVTKRWTWLRDFTFTFIPSEIEENWKKGLRDLR